MTSSPSPSPSALLPPGRWINGLSWTLRIVGALAFLAAGTAKLAGVPMMVGDFDHIGIGQWLRVATGLIEVIAAVALLVPATVAISGAFLALMMLVAIGTHLFVIGGSAVPALVLMLLTATLAWIHRARLASLLRASRRA